MPVVGYSGNGDEGYWQLKLINITPYEEEIIDKDYVRGRPCGITHV